MPDDTVSELIRYFLDVDPTTGKPIFVLTPDLARQIVAKAGIPALEGERINKLEARIAALESQMRGHVHYYSDEGGQFRTSEATGQVFDAPESQPAAPDADEAAVEAMIARAEEMVSALCQPKGTPGKREWIMSIPARPDYDPDLVISTALHAAGKEIAALRAKLSEEARICDLNISAAERCAEDRDRLKEELAAERAAHDATKDWGHVEEGKVEKLTVELAAMKERAERAEIGLSEVTHLLRDATTKADAARAEADAAKAEVAALKERIAAVVAKCESVPIGATSKWLADKCAKIAAGVEVMK